MKIHTGQKDFQCKICGKYFRLKHHLKSHIMLHMQNKMWERENSLTINNYFLWDGCVCILISNNISVRRLWIRVNSNRCLDSNDSKNITLWTNWGYSCINRCSIPQAVCWWKLVSQTTFTVFIYLNEATHKLNEMLMCMTFLWGSTHWIHSYATFLYPYRESLCLKHLPQFSTNLYLFINDLSYSLRQRVYGWYTTYNQKEREL